jgi:hypothetical protein
MTEALSSPARRLIEAAANETEFASAMSIGRNRDLHSRSGGKTRVFGGKVKPVWAGIDFKKAAALLRVLDDTLDIEVVAGPFKSNRPVAWPRILKSGYPSHA